MSGQTFCVTTVTAAGDVYLSQVALGLNAFRGDVTVMGYVFPFVDVHDVLQMTFTAGTVKKQLFLILFRIT